jgi:hypothetical protein
VRVDGIEGAGPGGAVRFVRRELGVEAFGINWFEIPPNASGHEHDETGSDQEEVSVVVGGGGHWRRPARILRASRGRSERKSPSAQLDDTVTFDITTAGDGDPSWGGFVGSAPILSTTPMPEETLPTSA